MKDTVFTMRSTPYKFGVGATSEIGSDLASLGLKRVLIVTDAGVASTGLTERVIERVRAAGIEAGLFQDVSIEPTDTSVNAAIEFALAFGPDGYVAVGGGSVMDTAKIMNLYVTYPAPLLTYVNAPIGEGRPVPGPLKPMVCLPTTAGHIVGEHHDRRSGHDGAAREDGDFASLPARDAGHPRPAQYPVCAANGECVLRG
jgi:alcohol dehydrogenase class IV